MKYTTPTGTVNNLYRSILTQPHTLIAGSTGSGKSVIINGLIYTALFSPPGDQGGGVWLILCDPKATELHFYKNLPHTLFYSDTIAGISGALKMASDLMESRQRDMNSRNLRETDRGHVYVILDEIADLILKPKGKNVNLRQENAARDEIVYYITHIARLGRASHVHLIAASQDPSRETLNHAICQNFTCRIALRCDRDIESRQIIGVKGAEDLPQYGDCLLKAPSQGITHYTGVRMYTQEELTERVRWWTDQQPPFLRRPEKRGLHFLRNMI
jgi:S-DNA-T family DNA segregation ATPase FtsK/SpoIIIE